MFNLVFSSCIVILIGVSIFHYISIKDKRNNRVLIMNRVTYFLGFIFYYMAITAVEYDKVWMTVVSLSVNTYIIYLISRSFNKLTGQGRQHSIMVIVVLLCMSYQFYELVSLIIEIK